jgi:selenide,water dikinase
LARVEPARRDEILIGLDQPDDAAVIAVPAGKVLVQTTDFFSALVDDPFVFGKIAAEHALGDLFAMGAEPHSALATAVVPPASDDKLEQTLADLLAGANEVLLKAGAVLIGGHSSEGDELALGLAVNGFADPASLLRKGGLQAGDRLILTKPIGTGTLFAAEMRMQVKGRWIAAAVDSMLQSNRAGVDCLRRHGATACTDVTGFGLIGHLAEMTLASSVAVELDLSAVPILEGARDTAAAGLLSSLDAQNRSQRHLITNLAEAQSREELPLLFDPQTCGGLLAGVPDSQASACLAELHAAGYAAAAIIGSVTASGAAGVTIRPANRA